MDYAKHVFVLNTGCCSCCKRYPDLKHDDIDCKKGFNALCHTAKHTKKGYRKLTLSLSRTGTAEYVGPGYENGTCDRFSMEQVEAGLGSIFFLTAAEAQERLAELLNARRAILTLMGVQMDERGYCDSEKGSSWVADSSNFNDGYERSRHHTPFVHTVNLQNSTDLWGALAGYLSK